MAQPAAIARLLEDLTPAMERHGFRPQSDRSEWTGKVNIFSWERRTWKLDVVRLSWSVRRVRFRVSPMSSCYADGAWSVPIGDKPIIASALNAIAARRGVALVELPRTWPVIAAWLEARWRTEMVADIEHAVAWCDRCGTRDGALADLAREDRNGPPAGSEAYLAIERYVIDHAPSL